jgi:hypothetical protein
MKTVLLQDRTQFESWILEAFSSMDLLTEDDIHSLLIESAPAEYPCLGWIKYTDDIYSTRVAAYIYRSQIDSWAKDLNSLAMA